MRWKLAKRESNAGGRWMRYGWVALCCVLGSLSMAGQGAQSAPQGTVAQAPVEVRGKMLFSVQGVLSFSAQSRANAIGKRIEDISKDVTLKPQGLSVSEAEGSSDIVAGDLVVMSVTDQDAHTAGTSRQALAKDYAQRINDALGEIRSEYSFKSLTLGGLYSVLATLVLMIVLRFTGFVFHKLYHKVNAWRGTVIPSLRIQQFELLPADRIADFVIGLAKLLRLAVVLVVLYGYASLVLGFFPWTRGYARILLDYVLSPLRLIGNAVVAYLPNLFFIAVIVLISFYVIKFVRVIFTEIEKETITLPNFYPDWAEPTYKIVRVLIVVLTVIVAFPYVPGAKSPAFQGVSIFLGVLLSLGSTSAVANVVSGVILTYMRAFKMGDRVRIADTEGDVVEKTLLITRIRTIKNVEITIANAMVLSSHIVNFSAQAQGAGLILHTEVTIGYDAPWRQIHELLLAAAAECEGIVAEPKPFVLQTALDDFYVHYEINAVTRDANRMAGTYSLLRQKIQDKFFEAGVEIMSPHFASVRDGNRVAIPDAYLPEGYKAPRFGVGLEGLTGGAGKDAAGGGTSG
jgi:small-conductance mechanosensitive channel